MVSLFNNIYQNKKILITGNTGFKGSWLSTWLLLMGANVKGISLMPNTRPNHFDLLENNMETDIIDITFFERLKKSILDYNPDIVFHLAAQPLVRKSFHESKLTFETNIMGTVNLFESLRCLKNLSAVINITTDKCYENVEQLHGYKETDKLGGFDPYSASKACSELITSSFRNSFFNIEHYGKEHKTLIATARAGNVIGGGDWSEDRLIPDLVKGVNQNISTIIRNPNSIRPWQHVLESLTGYLLLGQKLVEGKTEFADAWNFGPQKNDCVSVQDVIRNAQKIWSKINIKFDSYEKLHETKILMLDSTKSRKLLKWMNVWDTQKAIENTISWYIDYYEKGKIITTNQIIKYVDDAKNLNYEWA